MDKATTDKATMVEVINKQQTNLEVPDATTSSYSLHSWICTRGQSFRQDPRWKEYWAFEKDWLGPGLIHESKTLFPNPSGINSDDNKKRDSIAFQRNKIALLFPCGRMFASFK
jgi:hypothetical protein